MWLKQFLGSATTSIWMFPEIGVHLVVSPCWSTTIPIHHPWNFCEVPISDQPGSGPAPLAVKKTHPRRYPELRRYEKPGYIQALHPLHPSNAWRVPGSMWFRMHTGNTFSPVTHDCGSKPPNRDLLLVNPWRSQSHGASSPKLLTTISRGAFALCIWFHPVRPPRGIEKLQRCNLGLSKNGLYRLYPSFILIGKLIKHVGAPHFQSNPLIGGPTVGVVSYNVVKDRRKPN